MNFLAWIILFVGIWVFISPWVLDFAGLALAFWSNLVSGILVAAISVALIVYSRSRQKSDSQD